MTNHNDGSIFSWYVMMMKYLLVIVGILISNVAYASEFTDLDGYQYADSVRYIQDAGVVQGYPDGSYGVDRAMTRAEMMKIILESRFIDSGGRDIGNIVGCYSDVDDEWYARYICYATVREMVKGIGDDRFGPEQTVTIAQGLKIAINAFGGLGVVEGEGEDRYQPFVDRAHDNNIMSKYAIYPDAPMTRGMMAYLTHQLMLNSLGDREFDNIRQVGSIGCGVNPPGSAPTEFIVNGVTRRTITDIPSNYDPNKPTQLIVAWHGRTNSNSEVRSYYKIARNAPNAIVVYPSGLPESGPSRSWSTTSDVAFFDTIIQEMSQQYCINQDEITIIGHSLGAYFTNVLACMRGDVIRAMGSVGGSSITKDCSGPVAAMIMHHPDDKLASFAGGEAARDRLLAQNRCNVDSAVPMVGASSKSNCIQYTCMTDAPVIWCPHVEDDIRGYYYPHTWPSFATPMITDFWKGL